LTNFFFNNLVISFSTTTMRVLAIACVALAVFVGCCSAATVTLKANFKLVNQNQFPNGILSGMVYYYYNDKDLLKSRTRFETNYIDTNGRDQVHVDLYHYENGAMYSFCSACEADLLLGNPEPWYKIDTDINCETGKDGYTTCDRTSAGFSNSVVKFSTKGTPGNNDFKVRYVKFQDGREYTFSECDASIKVDNYKTKFQLEENSGCPAPQCRSFVDVVFILDASSSVDDGEWGKQKEFLSKAVSKFAISASDANIGIIEFAAPWKTCCCAKEKDCKDCYKQRNNDNMNEYWRKQWMTYTCTDSSLHLKTEKTENGLTRYIDDCVFDQRCLPEKDDTAKVFFELGYVGYQDKVNSLERITGHTCQRYGLKKAYEMLFENNKRCPVGKDKSECPIPVVIVVTDGEDLCHTSTQEWAKKVREADPRGMLIEVGVGLKSNYDKKFIADLSTQMPGYNMEFNVNNHAELDTILDRLMAPACSMGQLNGTSSCLSCKGQCVCGDCLCPPECDTDSFPVCKDVACIALTPEHGCKVTDAECSVTDSQCYTPRCDNTEKSREKRCKADPVDCAAYFASQGRPLKACEYTKCQNGCNEKYIYKNHSYCRELAGPDLCLEAECNPNGDGADPNTGCIIKDVDCSYLDETCVGVRCVGGICTGDECETPCNKKEGDEIVLRCPPQTCVNVRCNPQADEEHRCETEPVVCEASKNKCKESVCQGDEKHFECVEVPIEDACDDMNKAGGCRTYTCDPEVVNPDGTYGACVPTNLTHKPDNCIDYTCGDDDMWIANPKCANTKACKLAKCDDSDGSCYEVEISCRGKVKLPNKCFEAACREPDGCYKKQYRDAYFDVCGNCISAYEADSTESFSSETMEECTMTSEEELHTEGLAAAAIALIVIGAILIGAALALSSVVGTKALIDRANNAADQAVVSNPLFEDSQTEMSNPAFMGESV